jgi:nucleoside-diphosphate-sugar epimerase
MPQWLIIGGAGFLGSHLVERLLTDDSNKVAVSDILHPDGATRIASWFDKIRYRWQSVEDINAGDFSDIDFVIYCAAQADVALALSSPRHTFQQNVMSLVHVLEILRNGSTDTKFIYVSSYDAYGMVPHDHIPVTEDEALRPVNPYGVSKACADLLCQSYAKTFGMQLVVLRCSAIFGPRPRTTQVIPMFIKRALQNKDIIVEGDGSQTGDFNYVSNVVDGIMLATKNGRSGGVYNLGSGQEISVLSLAKWINALTGSNAGIVFRPWRKGEQGKRLVLSIAKAERELGYKPTVVFEEGLRRTIEWFKATQGLLSRRDSLTAHSLEG